MRYNNGPWNLQRNAAGFFVKETMHDDSVVKV